MSDTTVTYCTPDDVAETLDLPDPNDEYGYLTFTNVSHPSYDRVCKMIRANEDQIDRRTKRSWRENFVKEQVLSISEYWKDVNGYRFDYYKEGGNFVQLRKDVRPWDPNPRYADESTTKVVDSSSGIEANKVCQIGKDIGLVSSISQTLDGKYSVTYVKQIYSGDKIELRNRLNQWVDISKTPESTYPQTGIRPEETHFWFDYQYGKLYLRTNLFQAYGNSVRITYRYGSEEEEVPSAINRLCCLMTAVQILNMQFYNIKVGAGGDLGSVRDSMVRTWTDEMGSIWASYQRAGKVHSMLR